jgi:endonuclease/exonuclease/phosphatase family metal-dependent hydrolase
MKSLLSILFLVSALPLHASITLGTYNIRNFDYDERYRISTNKIELSSIIKKLNVDVLGIQEINNTQEFEKFVASKLPDHGTELSRCGGAHGQKLGFVYNKSKVELLSFNEDLTVTNPGGEGTCDSGSRPLAIALFQIKATKQRFYAITVHLKSGSNASSLAKRNAQFKIIQNLVNELKAKTGVKDFFMSGDFNTTGYLAQEADFENLNKIVKELNMVSLTSEIKCSAYWWGGVDDGIELPSLLDHVIVSPGLMKARHPTMVSGHCQTVSCKEAPIRQLGTSYAEVSDHCPITARVQ